MTIRAAVSRRDLVEAIRKTAPGANDALGGLDAEHGWPLQLGTTADVPALLDKVCLYVYAVEQAKRYLRGESRLPDAFQKPRSPPWTRDELILALDLYFRHRPDKISKTHPEVLRLSEVLNELPLHGARATTTSFRNPSGVYMKLCNFLRLDPSYPGKRLESGSKADAEVWADFAHDRALLGQIAAAIVARHSKPEAPGVDTGDEVEDDDFPEGRILYRLHRSRERSRRLRDEAKKRAMKRHGRIFCAVCRFDFAATYGPWGDGYIECHHTKPVFELNDDSKTRVEDIALLCANCHRMVHRRRPWLSLDQLASLLAPRG